MSKEKKLDAEAFGNFLDAFVGGIEKEATDKYGTFVNEILVEHDYLNIADPEHYSLLISTTFDSMQEIILKKAIPPEHKLSDKLQQYKVEFIYQNYHFVDKHLKSVIYKREGMACSTDKTRWLIDAYIAFIRTGNLPVIDLANRSYWHPRAGTPQQWMHYIDTMYKLHSGELTEYAKAQLELLQAYSATEGEEGSS